MHKAPWPVRASNVFNPHSTGTSAAPRLRRQWAVWMKACCVKSAKHKRKPIMSKLLHSPRTLFFLALAFFSAAIAGYRQFYLVAPEQQYRMQAVETGDISQTVSANGTINPVSLINVGTQVSGTVKKLYVDFNSEVEKGQILLELDAALLVAQQKQSE